MKSLKSKFVTRFVHVSICMMVLAMPLLVIGYRHGSPSCVEYARMLLLPVSFMFLFYLNYHVLIDRYFFTRRMGSFYLSNLLVVFVLMVGVHTLFHMTFQVDDFQLSHGDHSWITELDFMLINSVGYVLMVGLAVAIKVTGGWYRSETERRELERYRTEAELQNLKSQLNPHFIFNTLNNIYSLIQIDAERAQKVVHDLSRLLRYVLYESSRETVPLGEEIEFVGNYIELMRIRLSRNVELNVSLPPATSCIPIAPLLFISLIENAFKHFAGNEKHAFISIVVCEKGGVLRCEVENSCLQASTGTKKGSSGIGLVNLSKRLEMIYHGNYTFAHGCIDDVYKVCLTINLKKDVA